MNTKLSIKFKNKMYERIFQNHAIEKMGNNNKKLQGYPNKNLPAR